MTTGRVKLFLEKKADSTGVHLIRAPAEVAAEWKASFPSDDVTPDYHYVFVSLFSISCYSLPFDWLHSVSFGIQKAEETDSKSRVFVFVDAHAHCSEAISSRRKEAKVATPFLENYGDEAAVVKMNETIIKVKSCFAMNASCLIYVGCFLDA